MSSGSCEIVLDVPGSLRSGCIDGVRAELRHFLPSGWLLGRGASELESTISYEYSESSDADLERVIRSVSYSEFALLEGRGTAICRLISMLGPCRGYVLVFRASNHPKPARAFLARITYKGVVEGV